MKMNLKPQKKKKKKRVVQKNKNTKDLYKTVKSLGLTAMEGSKANVSLNKDHTTRFEPLKNANIFKTSYQPSEKISAASHKCNSRTTKDWSSKILKDAV